MKIEASVKGSPVQAEKHVEGGLSHSPLHARRKTLVYVLYSPFPIINIWNDPSKNIGKSVKKIYGLNFRKGHISKDTGLRIIIFAINKSYLDAFMANEVNFEIL